jgi:hypothetical protein
VRVFLNRLRLLPNYIRQRIINLNLFERKTPRTVTIIFREQLLTRIFILLLTILSVAAGFYTFLVVQNQVVTISQPSLADYQQLYNNYSDTLQCPCSQLSVPYGTFLNVTFVLHQVCTSDFVLPIWLNYLASFDPILVPSWTVTRMVRDFRTTGASYFQLLATFCSLAKSNIEDAQRIFTNTQFINAHVLASPLFNQQIQAMIESYISNTQDNFKRTFEWIDIAFITNFLLTGANTNFVVTVTENDTLIVKDLIFERIDQLNHNSYANDGVCACPTESLSCFVTNLLYINGSSTLEFEQIFSELSIGCIPLVGFLHSKYAWWYNETYLKNIQATYAIVINSQSSLHIKSLNTSIPTRFKNSSLEYLLREMFIETWIRNDTHFDQFYNECAPISCSYTIIQRRDIIVVLFLLISICGGLKEVLRILVPAFFKLIFFFMDWWKNRDTQHRK